MSRPMKSAAVLAAAAAIALSAGACNTAKPAPQMGARTSMLINGDPNAVLQSLRSTAGARGGQVVEETANSMAVDFGTQTMRIPVPTKYGLWGSRVSWRDTEVHSSAFYWVEPCEGGTRVTVTEAGWIANPFFRVMAQLGGFHGTIDGYLTALGARFGEAVTPEHVVR